MRKYAIFKAEEFDEWYDVIRRAFGDIQPMPQEISGAVVLRYQDVFASEPLHIYSRSVALALKVIKEVLGPTPDTQLYNHLQNLADFFEGEATKADLTPDKKIPD